jgi:hypothetical protein
MIVMGWDELRAACAARFGLTHDQPGWIGVEPRPHDEGAGQLVRIERVTVDAADWVLLMSPVCFEPDLAHRDALAHNLRLTVGSLALDGNRYELRLALAVAGLDGPTLCAQVVVLAKAAARLRQQVQSRTFAASLLTMYTE